MKNEFPFSNAHRHNIFTSRYNVVIITKLIGRTRQLLEIMLDRVSRRPGSPFRQRVTCWPFAEPATSIYGVIWFYFYFFFCIKNRTLIIPTDDIMHFYNIKERQWKSSTVYIIQSVSTSHLRCTHRFRESHLNVYCRAH